MTTSVTPSGSVRTTRRRNLYKLYAAEVLSGTGDGVMWVALVSSIADEPRPGLWLGLAVVARLSPRAVLSFPAGALVDRSSLRSLLVGADLARAAAMLVLAGLAAAGAGPGPLILLMLLSYVLGAPTRPGLSAALPRISGETQLAEANAILSTVRQLMTFVGPFVGVAVAAWSTTGAYVVNSASFVASAALILGLRAVRWPERAARDDTDRTAGPFTGVRDVVGSVAGLRSLIGLVGAMYLVRGAEMVLWVLVVRDVLDEDPSHFGYLAGAVGLGAVLATPVARRSANSESWPAMLAVGVVITALPTAALGFTDRIGASVVLLLFVGAGMVVFEVISVVTIQRTVPSDRLGRVFGLVNAASNTGKLLGAVIAPALVVLVDVEGALVVISAVLAVWAVAAVRPIHRLGASASARRSALAPIVDTLDRLELFDGAPRTSLERLADALVEEEVDAGTVLVREGDEADDLFVARSGEFDVTVHGERINEMKAGAWFGEIGLVDRVPRTATVITTTPATVWRIPGDVFLDVLEDSGAPPAALLDGIADRLATGRATTARSEARE